jgi:hypothetical protein
MLDDELYPRYLSRLYKGQIVYDCDIYYKAGTSIVEYESASIFLDTGQKPKLVVGASTWLYDILLHKEEPDLLLPLYPAVGNGDMPLWFFYGAHDYRQP